MKTKDTKAAAPNHPYQSHHHYHPELQNENKDTMKAAPNHSFYNIFYKKIDFHKSDPADDWKIIFLIVFLSLINFNRKRFMQSPGR